MLRQGMLRPHLLVHGDQRLARMRAVDVGLAGPRGLAESRRRRVIVMTSNDDDHDDYNFNDALGTWIESSGCFTVVFLKVKV